MIGQAAAGQAADQLRAAYSTAAAQAVAEFVAARYELPGPLACSLLNRGFNDTFIVSTPENGRYVLRLSGQRRRGPADVASETGFLAYLDAAGVPVAAALPARDGALFSDASIPEGRRPAVLFRHAEGRSPQLDTPEDARGQGATLARIHTAAASFPDREAGRYRLDLDHLLHRPLATASCLDAMTGETRDAMTGLASRLAGMVEAMEGLSWTRCHGDCHGANARIVTVGPKTGDAVFFDFDDGGYGYLAYDLAVHLWAQVSFQRQRYAMWHAFIDGYRAVRPIKPADLDAVLLFVPIRHIWLLGEMAGRIGEWGSEAMPAAWLDRQMKFLRSWETERLSHRLL